MTPSPGFGQKPARRSVTVASEIAFRNSCHYPLLPPFKQLSDCQPFQRAVGDAALMVVTVAEEPGFADKAIPG
jgi:hypothetical protein